MPQNLNSFEVNLNDSKKFIQANVELQCKNRIAPRIYVQGQPGCGKSDLMREICQENGWGLVVKYVSNMALEQITGLPLKSSNDESTTIWTRPELLKFDDLDYCPDCYQVGKTKTVLFLDDFHLCDRSIHKYMFQLLTYMKLHGYAVPENTAIVLAGNRISDKALAMPIPAPIANRIMFIDVKCDYKDWLNNFAFKHGVREDICSFINTNGNTVLTSEPLESIAWASPRSWTYLSDQLDAFDANNSHSFNDMTTVAIGLVGSEIGHNFMTYRELFAKWNYESMFTDSFSDVKRKINADCSKNASAVYALLHAGIGWIISTIKNNDTVKDLDKRIEFLYDVFAYVLSMNDIRHESLITNALSYLVTLQEKTCCKVEVSSRFIDCCAKQRNIDKIMYKHLSIILSGGRINDIFTKDELKELDEAAAEIVKGNSGL